MLGDFYNNGFDFWIVWHERVLFGNWYCQH